MGPPLPRSSPSEEGLDPGGLSALLDAVAGEPDVELHSLVVVRHGRVVAEGWWAPYAPERPHLLYSLSKSFTSAAAGAAVAEGRLDLDAPVVAYFPEFADEVVDERCRRMRIRDIAAMASGHLEDTFALAVRRDPAEPVRGFLLTPPDRDPGSVFAYDQPCAYTLAAIVQRVAGSTLTEYLRPRLFEPLGIETYGWLQHPAGRDLGFSGLHATTEAVARFGLLLLQRGRWEGRQLLRSAWVDEATRAHVPTPREPDPDWQQGYGFQFWRSRHGYRGDGAYGQFCLVLPEQDLVVATTGDAPDMQRLLDAVWAHLLPAVRDPAPAGRGDEELRDRLTALELPALDLAAAPPSGRERWAGAAFRPAGGLVAAQPTLTGLRLEAGDDGWVLVLEDDGTPLRCPVSPVGSGSWRVTSAPDAPPVAVSGGWADADRFAAEVVLLETPHRLRVAARLASGEFTAEWRTTPLHPAPLRTMRMPRER